MRWTSAQSGRCSRPCPFRLEGDEVVEHAEIEGGDEDLLAALRALPDREYESLDDIGESLSSANGDS